jgi:hypothetical protein
LVALSDHVNNANPIFADRCLEPRTEPIAPPVQHFMADLDPALTQKALKLNVEAGHNLDHRHEAIALMPRFARPKQTAIIHPEWRTKCHNHLNLSSSVLASSST